MRCKTKPLTKESLMCVMFWCVSPPGLLVSTLEWHCPDGSSEVDPLPAGGADGGSNFVRAIRAIEADVSLSDAKKDDPIIGKPAVCATDGRGVRSRCSTDQELGAEVHDEEAVVGFEQHSMPPKATTKHPRHRSGCTCIICIQSPSGTGPKHDQCCSCTICDIKQRRRRTQLLWRAKKKIEKAKHAPKELKSPNTDEEPHQSANNSGNTSKNHEHNT